MIYNNDSKHGTITKTCAINGKLKFEDSKHCLEAFEIENKIS